MVVGEEKGESAGGGTRQWPTEEKQTPKPHSRPTADSPPILTTAIVSLPAPLGLPSPSLFLWHRRHLPSPST